MYIGKLYNVSPLRRISRSRKLESQALAACSILLYCHAFILAISQIPISKSSMRQRVSISSLIRVKFVR